MKHLTKEQRCQIKTYLACGKSKQFISEVLSVDKTTIYRELNRTKKKIGIYNPNFADMLASERKEKFKRKRKFTKPIEELIIEYITEKQWSSEQIVECCY